MLLTDATLNRTLLARQHLLGRVRIDPIEMTRHLVGLQAQAPVPPYLSLQARLTGFDPHALSDALADRRIVRVLLMRGTVHAVTPADAATLRPLVQPLLDRASRTSGASKPAVAVPRRTLVAAGRELLAGGGLPVTELGKRLAERFPGVPGRALANTLRECIPLVQLPPRGLWQRSGGVVYATLEDWAGPLPEPASANTVLTRYLRAFGPASAADIATWSGMTGVAAILRSLGDEIVRYRSEAGRELVDLADLTVCDADTPAPVRLLGRYDNVWLAHAGRDRVTTPDARRRWAGTNGGVANTVFVDGYLRGLWRHTPAGSLDFELFGRLTRAQRRELDEEAALMRELLAR